MLHYYLKDVMNKKILVLGLAASLSLGSCFMKKEHAIKSEDGCLFTKLEEGNFGGGYVPLKKELIIEEKTHHLGDDKRPVYELWWDVKKAESLSLKRKFIFDGKAGKARISMEVKFCDYGAEVYLNDNLIGLTPTRKEEEWKKNPKYFKGGIDIGAEKLINGENTLKLISRNRGNDKFGKKEINYDDFLIRMIKLEYE